MREPAFWSAALSEIVDPDYTHVAVDVLPAHATADPAAWARGLFSLDALPRWVALPLRVRGQFRRRHTPCTLFGVAYVTGDEAIVAVDGRHLDLRIGVGVDEQAALVRVVTAVRFKGRASRGLSLPARAALPFVLRGMIARSRRSLSGVTR